MNLDDRKATGPDELPCAFLRRYWQWVAEYLCIIYRVSLTTSALPDDWRCARIKPVFKGGNREDVNCYRPISLTSTCCKIMEHCIYKYISEFLYDRQVLNANQHGFRKGLSTCSQLTEVVHDFASVLNIQGQTDLICVDFAKAFDCVPHNKLLYKLSVLGIDPSVLSWIQSYLDDRTQFVDIHSKFSQKLRVFLVSHKARCWALYYF